MKRTTIKNFIAQTIILCVFFLLLTSGNRKAEAIDYGQDECAFCKMKNK